MEEVHCPGCCSGFLILPFGGSNPASQSAQFGANLGAYRKVRHGRSLTATTPSQPRLAGVKLRPWRPPCHTVCAGHLRISGRIGIDESDRRKLGTDATQLDFETGELPPALVQSRDDMRWAEHWVFLIPLWHGTMPVLFKGFEHIFRPGFAMEYSDQRVPKRCLLVRSARIVRRDRPRRHV